MFKLSVQVCKVEVSRYQHTELVEVIMNIAIRNSNV